MRANPIRKNCSSRSKILTNNLDYHNSLTYLDLSLFYSNTVSNCSYLSWEHRHVSNKIKQDTRSGLFLVYIPAPPPLLSLSCYYINTSPVDVFLTLSCLYRYDLNVSMNYNFCYYKEYNTKRQFPLCADYAFIDKFHIPSWQHKRLTLAYQLIHGINSYKPM